jgi:hypothetical protein
MHNREVVHIRQVPELHRQRPTVSRRYILQRAEGVLLLGRQRRQRRIACDAIKAGERVRDDV